MKHFLLAQYPSDFVPIKKFGEDHPELLPERRSRGIISRLASEPSTVQRIFRKRFGRWFIHIPSFLEHMGIEQSLPDTGTES